MSAPRVPVENFSNSQSELAFQPEAFSLTLSEPDFTIVRVSSSAEQLIAYTREELVGHPLVRLIGQSQMQSLESQLNSKTSLESFKPITCTVCASFSSNDEAKILTFEDRSFDISLHPSAGSVIAKFRPSPVKPSNSVPILLDSIADSVQKIRRVSSVEELLNLSSQLLRKMIHVDRVMIYEFRKEDHHISVVAEDKELECRSFLGHHYPGSHMSEHARRMDRKNHFKIFYDVPNIFPGDLMTPELRNLNLTAMRCMSSAHIKLLDTMDIKFSMSVPIIIDDELWGLIAYHHHSPQYISHSMRVSCELFGDIISSKLMSLLGFMKHQQLQDYRSKMAKVLDTLNRNDDWKKVLIKEGHNLYGMFRATGLVIRFDSQSFMYPKTPMEEQINLLIPHIVANQKDSIFVSNCLSSSHIHGHHYRDIASGVLAMILSESGNQSDMIIFFREERRQTLKWVDNPKEVTIIEGYSEPWLPLDLEMAYELKRHLLEARNRYSDRQSKEEISKKALFIDTMCHEIRNPINGILGTVSLLHDCLVSMEHQVQNIDPELKGSLIDNLKRIRDGLNDIDECANHQRVIANDVLSLSKLEQDRVRLENAPMNLTHILQQILHPYQSVLEEKGVTLEVNNFKDEVHILGDKNRLKQIICNLLDNAVKFTHSGFIRVSAASHGSNKQNQELFEILIEDSGLGLDQEETDRLFVPYSQANQGISSKYGGTGLGLVICQQLAKLMNGYIKIKSQKDVGTEVKICFASQVIRSDDYLKLSSPPVISRSVSHNAPQLKRILIAEDNVINQKVLARILDKMGHICDIANNGLEAVELYKMHRQPIIFMDIQMPIMDGLEATQLIRRWELEEKLPASYITCVSGNAREEHKDTAFGSGVDAYLVKPFRREEITSLINRLHISRTSTG